jgi:hypothetical protein
VAFQRIRKTSRQGRGAPSYSPSLNGLLELPAAALNTLDYCEMKVRGRRYEPGSRAVPVGKSVRLVCLEACWGDGSVEGWFLVLFRGDNSR